MPGELVDKLTAHLAGRGAPGALAGALSRAPAPEGVQHAERKTAHMAHSSRRAKRGHSVGTVREIARRAPRARSTAKEGLWECQRMTGPATTRSVSSRPLLGYVADDGVNVSNLVQTHSTQEPLCDEHSEDRGG